MDVLTGDFFWNYTDLNLSGRQDLGYTRYYTSTQARYGRMGRGWSDTYDYRLSDQDDIIIISLPAGKQTYFLKEGSDLVPAEGSPWTLTETGAGYTLTTQDQCRYLFDESGYLTEIVPLGEYSTTLSYNEKNQLATASNATGELEFFYRADGRLTSVKDSADREVYYEYSSNARLIQVENPDGDSFSYEYDDDGRLTGITDLNGEVYVTNQYDSKGRVTEQYVEEMGEFQFTYNESSRTNSYTRSDHSRVTIVYDEQNRIVSMIDEDGTKTYTYNGASQRTEEIDRKGNRTVYEYDQNSNLMPLGTAPV